MAETILECMNQVRDFAIKQVALVRAAMLPKYDWRSKLEQEFPKTIAEDVANSAGALWTQKHKSNCGKWQSPF